VLGVRVVPPGELIGVSTDTFSRSLSSVKRFLVSELPSTALSAVGLALAEGGAKVGLVDELP